MVANDMQGTSTGSHEGYPYDFETPIRALPSSLPWMQGLPSHPWLGARRRKALLFETPTRPWLVVRRQKAVPFETPAHPFIASKNSSLVLVFFKRSNKKSILAKFSIE